VTRPGNLRFGPVLELIREGKQPEVENFPILDEFGMNPQSLHATLSARAAPMYIRVRKAEVF
jgi:hypothetical protein